MTFLALEQTEVNFRTKYLYCNNQQKIIFQISLIVFKSRAESWSTFPVRLFWMLLAKNENFCFESRQKKTSNEVTKLSRSYDKV